MFVVDLTKEHIAVAEAKRLGIPVVGIADTNSDPEAVDFPIPGNDDAIRSIKLFADMVADSFLAGQKLWEEKRRSMVDKDKEEAKAAQEAMTSKPATGDSSGPAIVKVSKGRKLVAAGMAEEAEIEMELDAAAEEPVEESATPAEPVKAEPVKKEE